MKTPAKGEFPYIDRALAAFRVLGWEISDCRVGLIIKGPEGTSEIWYSDHLVTPEVLDHITRRHIKAQESKP